MSNLILNDNTDTFTFVRVAWGDILNVTNFNIVSSKDLIAKGDAAGNPTRLDFSLVEAVQSEKANFQTFANRNAGLIVDLKFEGVQHFGYLESYNIAAKKTKTVTREEPDPTDPSTLIITSGDETTADIDFSFISLHALLYDSEEENLGLGLI